MSNITRLLKSLKETCITDDIVVAVDFDGTLCNSNFPDCGEPIQPVINFVKELKEQGAVIILWTCREGEPLNTAIKWCKEQGIIFDYINENCPKRNEYWGCDCRKVGADLYIDDKAISVLQIMEKQE